MTGTKKYISLADCCITTINALSAQYNHISLYYHGHPKHTKANLLPEQVLICACNFNSRSDRQGKKVGEK